MALWDAMMRKAGVYEKYHGNHDDGGYYRQSQSDPVRDPRHITGDC